MKTYIINAAFAALVAFGVTGSRLNAQGTSSDITLSEGSTAYFGPNAGLSNVYAPFGASHITLEGSTVNLVGANGRDSTLTFINGASVDSSILNSVNGALTIHDSQVRSHTLAQGAGISVSARNAELALVRVSNAPGSNLVFDAVDYRELDFNGSDSYALFTGGSGAHTSLRGASSTYTFVGGSRDALFVSADGARVIFDGAQVSMKVNAISHSSSTTSSTTFELKNGATAGPFNVFGSGNSYVLNTGSSTVGISDHTGVGAVATLDNSSAGYITLGKASRIEVRNGSTVGGLTSNGNGDSIIIVTDSRAALASVGNNSRIAITGSQVAGSVYTAALGDVTVTNSRVGAVSVGNDSRLTMTGTQVTSSLQLKQGVTASLIGNSISSMFGQGSTAITMNGDHVTNGVTLSGGSLDAVDTRFGSLSLSSTDAVLSGANVGDVSLRGEGSLTARDSTLRNVRVAGPQLRVDLAIGGGTIGSLTVSAANKGRTDLTDLTVQGNVIAGAETTITGTEIEGNLAQPLGRLAVDATRVAGDVTFNGEHVVFVGTTVEGALAIGDGAVGGVLTSRVGRVITGANVDLAFEASSLVGDAIVGAGSYFGFAGSTWEGSTDSLSSLALDERSVWRVTGGATVGRVANTGRIEFSGGNPGATLTVADYKSSNGTLTLGVVLDGDDSPADRINVTGTATGATTLQIIPHGGRGGQTENGILVVSVPESASATFALASPLRAGLYEYNLKQAGDNYYLSSAPVREASTPSITGPVGQLLTQAVLPVRNFRSRHGRRVWADSTRFDGRFRSGEAAYMIRLSGVVAGVDIVPAQHFFLGLYAGRGDASALESFGSTDVVARMGGVYGGFAGGGVWAVASVQAAKVAAEVGLLGEVLRSDGTDLLSSVEVGMHLAGIDFFGAAATQRTTLDDAATDNLTAIFANESAYSAKLGARARVPGFPVWASVAFVSASGGEGSASLSDGGEPVTAVSGIGGHSIEADLLLRQRLGEAWEVFGGAGIRNGKRINGWSANLAVSRNF